VTKPDGARTRCAERGKIPTKYSTNSPLLWIVRAGQRVHQAPDSSPRTPPGVPDPPKSIGSLNPAIDLTKPRPIDPTKPRPRPHPRPGRRTPDQARLPSPPRAAIAEVSCEVPAGNNGRPATQLTVGAIESRSHALCAFSGGACLSAQEAGAHPPGTRGLSPPDPPAVSPPGPATASRSTGGAGPVADGPGARSHLPAQVTIPRSRGGAPSPARRAAATSGCPGQAAGGVLAAAQRLRRPRASLVRTWMRRTIPGPHSAPSRSSSLPWR
jgi:hypothetical protein